MKRAKKKMKKTFHKVVMALLAKRANIHATILTVVLLWAFKVMMKIANQ